MKTRKTQEFPMIYLFYLFIAKEKPFDFVSERMLLNKDYTLTGLQLPGCDLLTIYIKKIK